MKKWIGLLSVLQGLAIAQISNPGFELMQWNGTDSLVAGWTGSGFGVGTTTNAFQGNKALSVWNWYFYGPGYVVNGNLASPSLPFSGTPYMQGGEPINFRPEKLRGYYLYDTTQTNTNADSAMIQITLRRFNSQSMQQEVVGWGEVHLPATGTYTLFELPVIYTSSETPDTVAVVIRSSLSGFCDSTTTGECLYLSVDQLSLEGISGIENVEGSDNLILYPNPSVDQLTVVVPSSEVILWDVFSADGRRVLSGSSVTSIISTDIGILVPGCYFFSVNTPRGRVSRLFIKG